jgi:murein DD-endopeptidase MepM/ murein hydrolase activator NlpD
MTQVLAGTTALFRDRDLFVHDGTKLRRFRVSAPVQAVLFVVLLCLVGWASYATARLITRPRLAIASTDARTRLLEQRQALIEAALAGQKIDPSMVQAAASSGQLAKTGPLARVEQQQLQQAALVAQALDVRYQVTAAELHKLGIKSAAAGQPSGVGGPFEAVGNPTFKALFNSWKKLDQLQNDVIAIPSDKPIRADVTFTSGYGVRADPFHAGAAMHPGIDLAGAYGTPIYATADGTLCAPAGTMAATATSSRSTTAAASAPATATCRRSSSRPGSMSPAVSRSAAWAQPAARPVTTFIMKSASTGAR